MNTLVGATYSPIERAEIADTARLVERISQSDLPAFIISSTGTSLSSALKSTGIVGHLDKSGFAGNVRISVDFRHTSGLLPDDLSGVPFMAGDEWVTVGVTSLHTDKHDSEQGQQLSLNHTKSGRSEFRLHPSRIGHDQLEGQWELFDDQTANLLWHGLADPGLIDPVGWRAEIGPGDLLVFDPANAHMVRSLELPRISEATFFDRVR